MKKILFILAFAMIGTSCLFAQNKSRRDLFIEQMTEKENLMREKLYSGHYDEGIEPLKDLILLVDTTTICEDPENNVPKAAMIEQKSMYQYDLACCYALTGQKKKALEALAQSVENGYNDYNHILVDTDFDSLRKDKKFQQLVQKVKEQTKLGLLKKSNAYDFADQTEIPAFVYEPMEDQNLKRVREYFQLDTIPGKDDELTHIKNLLHFAHDHIRHDGSNMAICEFDAIDIYNYYRSTGKGVNCRQLALSLCDMYLAMGYKARVVTCLPADPNDYECHVINTVYSESLQKWLYVDPTMDAWVMDENGTMLSIAEVRERLINDQPLVLCETANWNHENGQTKEYYLETYMAKNLYYFVCKNRSFFNQESIYRNINNEDIRLIPNGFVNDNFGAAKTTTNPEVFWMKP